MQKYYLYTKQVFHEVFIKVVQGFSTFTLAGLGQGFLHNIRQTSHAHLKPPFLSAVTAIVAVLPVPFLCAGCCFSVARLLLGCGHLHSKLVWPISGDEKQNVSILQKQLNFMQRTNVYQFCSPFELASSYSSPITIIHIPVQQFRAQGGFSWLHLLRDLFKKHSGHFSWSLILE